MSPADRDTARAQHLLNELREHDDCRCVCVTFNECDANKLTAIAQALADVRAEASEYFNQTCADHPDVRLDLACEKCIEEQLAPPAPERRSRCDGRYPVPHPRDEPFPVTYACALEVGHDGPCANLESAPERREAQHG